MNVHFYCRQATDLRQTSVNLPCTKPSVNSAIDSDDYLSSNFKSLLQIHASALTLHDNSIGKGVFAKCYHALLVSHRDVCVKGFRQEKKYYSVLALEAVIMSKLCHPNLPWFYGTVCAHYSETKMTVMSFQSIEGKPCTLYDALNPDKKGTDLALIDWRKLMLDLVAALYYIPNNGLAHNDIMNNNIVLDGSPSQICCVLIDFGKGCFISQGKRYTEFLSHASSITNSTIRRLPLILEMVIVTSQHTVMCILQVESCSR